MKDAFKKTFHKDFEDAGLRFLHKKDDIISYSTYKVASPYLNLVVRDKDYAYNVRAMKWISISSSES